MSALSSTPSSISRGHRRIRLVPPPPKLPNSQGTAQHNAHARVDTLSPRLGRKLPVAGMLAAAPGAGNARGALIGDPVVVS